MDQRTNLHNNNINSKIIKINNLYMEILLIIIIMVKVIVWPAIIVDKVQVRLASVVKAVVRAAYQLPIIVSLILMLIVIR
ncbi:hypothetical protein BLA29_013292 [Euroglyphus maynei]|uniref:Uncharacterized protein n=1 Tax=Euroglyphus maynei TaxID=6958 RepID=A0A1Y3BG55_EURMA|nr:hypothetical protein BLA29_013292 [Euroglyphus maynei]